MKNSGIWTIISCCFSNFSFPKVVFFMVVESDIRVGRENMDGGWLLLIFAEYAAAIRARGATFTAKVLGICGRKSRRTLVMARS
jgi:hypothetical protein